VSTVLVLGGSGDYFEAADTVVMMDEFAPRYVCIRCTVAVRAIHMWIWGIYRE
jgi:predicted ABC-class ATPase